MSTQDEMNTYRQQEERIQAQSDAFVELLTKRGILGDHKISNEKIRAAQQERRKASYHNTEMLLKHYRTVVWQLESRPGIIAAELDRPFDSFDQLIKQLDVDLARGDRKREHELASVQKSRMVINRVNEALTVLKSKPENGERLYELIYLTFIAPEKLSHKELLYRLNMSSRSYYRLREQAITILSIRLWAAPTTEADFWLDMLTLLEST